MLPYRPAEAGLGCIAAEKDDVHWGNCCEAGQCCRPDNAIAYSDIQGNTFPSQGGMSTAGGGGDSVSSCSGCGSTGTDNVRLNAPSPFSASQVQRSWLPTQTSFYSSFSPGHFSEFDAKLLIYPVSGGISVTYFTPTEKLRTTKRYSYSFVDGLDGDTQDGIFHDLRNVRIKEMKMLNSSSSVVTSISQAATFELTHLTGLKEVYGLVNIAASTASPVYAGRLTKLIDLNGKQTTVAYKSWTQTQIDAAPDRQWQIDTISDSYSNQLTFTYDSTQHSSRWCVTQIDRNDSVSTTFTYNSTRLTSVNYPDSSQATYGLTYSSQYGMDVMSISDPYAREVDGSYYTRTNYAGNTSANPPLLSLQVPGEIMRRLNANSEVLWEQIIPTNYSLDEKMIISEGKMTVHYGDGSKQDVSAWNIGPGAALPQWKQYERMASSPRGNPTRFVSTTANSLVVVMEYVVADLTMDANVYSPEGTWTQVQKEIPPSGASESGSPFTYTYDSSGRPTLITYSSDSTSSAYAVNAASQPTRIRDRNNNVIKYTYDSNGNLTSTETGIVETSGSDVQSSSYAVSNKIYYSSGTSIGLLQAEMTPLYSSSTPTIHRTDYEYNSYGLVSKIIGPATASGQSRPETTFSYDSHRRLTSTTNPEGHTSTFVYDDLGRKTQTTYADSSTEQTLYGLYSGSDAGRVVKTKDRANVVTTYSYDSSGRLTQTVVGAILDSDILDSTAGTTVSDSNLKVTTVYTYKSGSSSLKATVTVNGAKTEFYLR